MSESVTSNTFIRLSVAADIATIAIALAAVITLIVAATQLYKYWKSVEMECFNKILQLSRDREYTYMSRTLKDAPKTEKADPSSNFDYAFWMYANRSDDPEFTKSVETFLDNLEKMAFYVEMKYASEVDVRKFFSEDMLNAQLFLINSQNRDISSYPLIEKYSKRWH